MTSLLANERVECTGGTTTRVQLTDLLGRPSSRSERVTFQLLSSQELHDRMNNHDNLWRSTVNTTVYLLQRWRSFGGTNITIVHTSFKEVSTLAIEVHVGRVFFFLAPG